jgi:hypothetical protein
MANSGSENELTTRQRRAISALISCRNTQEAAALAKVGERTLYRWLTLPAFRNELLAVEGLAIDAATRRLISLQDAAIETLAGLLETGNQTNQRLAATAILDTLLRLREIRNVEQRLADLEAAIYEHKKAA